MDKQSVLLIVILSLCACAVSLQCDLPPRHWCDTPQVAEQCQVYDSCAKYVWNQDIEVTAPSPVHISLYYESLCPGCRAFIKEQLIAANKAFGPSKPGSVLHVSLFPYGNAQESFNGSQWVFNCQHGQQECIGNVIETCSMSLLHNFTTYWPYITCIETSPNETDMLLVGKECANKLGIDFIPIQACAMGSLGNQLEHKMAEATAALVPPHKYVPWIVVNGVHTEEIQSAAQTDLIKLVCDTYKGPTPQVCAKMNEVNLPRNMKGQ